MRTSDCASSPNLDTTVADLNGADADDATVPKALIVDFSQTSTVCVAVRPPLRVSWTDRSTDLITTFLGEVAACRCTPREAAASKPRDGSGAGGSVEVSTGPISFTYVVGCGTPDQHAAAEFECLAVRSGRASDGPAESAMITLLGAGINLLSGKVPMPWIAPSDWRLFFSREAVVPHAGQSAVKVRTDVSDLDVSAGPLQAQTTAAPKAAPPRSASASTRLLL